MSNVTIFKQPNSPANTGRRELSDLAKSLLQSDLTTRRIQTNTNGTFKRIINGEQIGKAVRGEINVIIVNTLPKVSRVYYAGKYDPNSKPTLPDCWSNLGDKPEAAASNKQSSNCGSCPQNIQGSGDNGGRACRYQRRIAVLLENDPSGEIYQFNIPAKSLFGKGTDNVHPFESYTKYLPANGFSIDQVVTNISYDLNADSMELLFSPVREVSDDELALVQSAQQHPDAQRVVILTVAQQDKVEKLPPAAKKEEPKKVTRAAEPEEDEEDDEPVVRAKKEPAPKVEKTTTLSKALSAWGDEEDE
jgi:hypothetical protein